MGCWYLLLFPLTGLVQSSNPDTSERHIKKTYKFVWSSVSYVFKWSTINIISQNWMCSRTCEVDGLYGFDEFRLLDLKPLQQLSYETHDIHLRKRTYWVTTVKVLKGDHTLWPLQSRIAVTFFHSSLHQFLFCNRAKSALACLHVSTNRHHLGRR